MFHFGLESCELGRTCFLEHGFGLGGLWSCFTVFVKPSAELGELGLFLLLGESCVLEGKKVFLRRGWMVFSIVLWIPYAGFGFCFCLLQSF